MRQSLCPLDIATGTMLGASPTIEPLVDEGLNPRTALERAIRPALLRPPCLVSFSGGRDSSVVLAVAVQLARRDGLELPIPATNVFSSADGADETEWQEAVIDHLKLDEWLRLEHADELDVIGPYARRVMAAHGFLLPFNVHFHLPLLDAASGGALLTGIGGDELFAAACPGKSAGGPIRPSTPWGIAGAALRTARRALGRGRRPYRPSTHLPWLRPDAQRALTDRVAALAAQEPRSLQHRMAWWRELRYMDEGRSGLALTADGADVTLVHGLLDRSVWASVARTAGPDGFDSRTHGMASLFGDLLPGAVLGRGTKAHFDAAMWTATAQAFVDAWDGTGIPDECVDADVLRAHWTAGRPSAQSFSLLQFAWHASTQNHPEESLDGLLV